MTAVVDRYTRIADGFSKRVHALTGGDWSTPTPCPEWDVRALVAHVIDTHYGMLAELGHQYPESSPENDLPATWERARAAVLEAVNDPTTANRTVTSPFGELPFTDVTGGLLCADTIYHTWDLARATGQDETLDAAACEDVLAALGPMDADLRGPGLFADKVEPPADADAQTRLLCFGGRAA